jgi:peroxiredoxin
MPHAVTQPPTFRLKDTNSNFYYTFNDLKGSKGTLLMFLSANCPQVNHVIPEILMIAADYRVQGLGIIAIGSNHSSEVMTEFAFKYSFDFPFLHDEANEAANWLQVKCVPDFFLFDNQNQLFYHGQLDDSKPGNNIPLSGSDLRNAIDGVIYNRKISEVQKPSSGCDIVT